MAWTAGGKIGDATLDDLINERNEAEATMNRFEQKWENAKDEKTKDQLWILLQAARERYDGFARDVVERQKMRDKQELTQPNIKYRYLFDPLDLTSRDQMDELMTLPITTPILLAKQVYDDACRLAQPQPVPQWAGYSATSINYRLSNIIAVLLENYKCNGIAENSIHGRNELALRILMGDSELVQQCRSGTTSCPDVFFDSNMYPPLVLVEEDGMDGSLHGAYMGLENKFAKLPHYLPSLPFIIGIAIHWDCVQFYRITGTHQIWEFPNGYFNLKIPQNMAKFVHALINVGRYCTTVMTRPHLYMHGLCLPFGRATEGHSSTVTIDFKKVTKEFFSVECSDEEWVAGMRAFYDDIDRHNIAFVERRVRDQAKRCVDDDESPWRLTLHLTPIGVQRSPAITELPRAIFCIGSALRGLHQAGWTHNDVRLPNIVNTANGKDWYLIDCEYATRIGQPYLRYPGVPRDNRTVEQINEKCTIQRDLYQLATEIIRYVVGPNPPASARDAAQAADELEDGKLSLDQLLNLPWVQAAAQ